MRFVIFSHPIVTRFATAVFWKTISLHSENNCSEQPYSREHSQLASRIQTRLRNAASSIWVGHRSQQPVRFVSLVGIETIQCNAPPEGCRAVWVCSLKRNVMKRTHGFLRQQHKVSTDRHQLPRTIFVHRTVSCWWKTIQPERNGTPRNNQRTKNRSLFCLPRGAALQQSPRGDQLFRIDSVVVRLFLLLLSHTREAPENKHHARSRNPINR